MRDNRQLKEIREAISACTETLDHLDRAQTSLQGAGMWGLVDIFGGWFFSTSFKHNKMHEAQADIEKAKRSMRRLSKELADVRQFEQLNVQMGDLVSMADYFFDGAIADWLVQARIGSAREQIRRAQEQIWDIRQARQHVRGNGDGIFRIKGFNGYDLGHHLGQ